MGVLHKNEQYEDDMVEILEWLHKYVPIITALLRMGKKVKSNNQLTLSVAEII